MPEQPKSLYARLGGYDAIAAVVDDLLPRLREDSLLDRFWTSPRSVDTNNRERQLAIDFIAAAAGGPTMYLGRRGAGAQGNGHQQGRLCGVHAVFVSQRLPQKPPSSIINSNGPLSNPTPAVRPWPWERVFMRHTCRSQYPSGSVQLVESCHLFLGHDALDARDGFDGVHRGGIAGDLHVIRDALHLGSDDGDLPSGLLRQ